MFKEINLRNHSSLHKLFYSLIYGPKFRELRKLNNINIIDASKGITSKSSLDRWEKGNDNLSFSKIIELLQRIHIQPIEFLGSDIPSMLSALYQQSMIAYYNNDIDTLKKLLKNTSSFIKTFLLKRFISFKLQLHVISMTILLI